MQPTDQELLTAAAGGDRDALGALLRQYGPRVRAGLQINPKWRSVLEPNDVMQVTYFDAIHQIHQLPADVNAFAAWLRQVARNNLLSAVEWLEREKRPQPDDRIQPPRDANPVEWLCGLVTGTGTTPSRAAAKRETREILEAEIEKLPADYRDVLRLVFFEGKSVAETAEALGRTRGAVYMLRHRALERLRQELGTGGRFFSSWA